MPEAILPKSEITRRLSDRRLLAIKEATGVSYGTLKKLRDGKGNCTEDVLKRVSDYLTDDKQPTPEA